MPSSNGTGQSTSGQMYSGGRPTFFGATQASGSPIATAPAAPAYDENKYAQLYPNATPEQRRAQYDNDQRTARYKASGAGQGTQAASQGLYQYGGAVDPATGQPRTPGAYAEQMAGGAYLHAGQMAGRAAPQADFVKSQSDLDAGRAGILAGAGRLGQAYQIGEQQQGLADQYQNVINGTAGPSLAELAMQRASAQEAARNRSAVAGIGGPGGVAAVINAQNRNAVAQGELQQNLGVQRAAEIAQARGALGDVLTGIRGQTAGEATAYGNLGSQAAQIGQITGQQQLGNAALQAGQNALNQQGEQYYYGQGADWVRGQAGLSANYAQNWNNFYTGQQSQAQQQNQFNQTRSDAITGAILSGAATVGAGVLTGVTGGAAAPVLAASAADSANKISRAAGYAQQGTSSDIRAKTAIAPAGGDVAQAFRGIARANEAAGKIRGAEVQYPLGGFNDYGAVVPGNLDLENRPHVRNKDGSISTVRSMGVNIDGREVLIPTVSEDGRIMSDREAIEAYRRGGKHLGVYGSVGASNRAAQAIHDDQARALSSPFAPLSASQYHYKNPSAPGAEPGRHYGPMAQELEQTPAGASVVTRMPDGSKGIDTGRLALLNASETGQLRREVDALKGRTGKTAKKIRETEVTYPSLGVPTARYEDLKNENDRKEEMLRQLAGIGVTPEQRQAYAVPTQYPTLRQPSFTGY